MERSLNLEQAPAARKARPSCRVRWLGLCLLLSVLSAAAERAKAEGIRFDPVEIPAAIGGPGAYRFALEAMVVRPDDQNPHPLAIINHGSPRNADDRRRMSPFGLGPQAAAFARRGWTAVAFMRRGYGRSQGGWAESYGSCADPDYKDAGLAGAPDILAVAKFMATQPYVFDRDWISVGVSAGAFATIAMTSTPPPNLAAAIAFAPGRGSLTPDTVCGEDQLVDAIKQYGKSSKIPVLWISAENDHFFGLRLTEKLKNAFAKAGGEVTFIETPPFGNDGHLLFDNGEPIWEPVVDRFLKDNKLVLRDQLISIPEVAPPSSLQKNGQDEFSKYLEETPNKAFAISGSRFGWAARRRTEEDAKRDALNICASTSRIHCELANVNNIPSQ